MFFCLQNSTGHLLNFILVMNVGKTTDYSSFSNFIQKKFPAQANQINHILYFTSLAKSVKVECAHPISEQCVYKLKVVVTHYEYSLSKSHQDTV